jgi:aarF domain-containing kinase
MEGALEGCEGARGEKRGNSRRSGASGGARRAGGGAGGDRRSEGRCAWQVRADALVSEEEAREAQLRRKGMVAPLPLVLLEGSDRLIRDVVTVVAIVWDYWRLVLRREKEATAADWHAAHTQGAARLFRLATVNRGVYLKLGQHVNQLEYLLPSEYVKGMGGTLRAAPQSSLESVERTLREEWGCEPSELVSDLSARPIASASIAQVHTATWRATGEKVAIKVQHRGLAQSSEADVRAIAWLVRTLRRVFPGFNYQWLVDEIELNLPRELDFVLEARNMDKCAAAFADDASVVVPRVVWRGTSGRVLTMSFEEGVHVDDARGIAALGLDRAAIATCVTDVFARMIFELGWLHADPHAGNILVRPASPGAARPQVVLLDHGLYRALSEHTRVEYARLWREVLRGNEPGIREHADKLGAVGLHRIFASIITMRSWDDITAATPDSLAPPSTDRHKADIQRNAKDYADEVQAVLRTIPRELLLVLKTHDCLRTVEAALGRPTNTVPVLARVCARAVRREDARLQNIDPNSWTAWLHAAYDLLQLEAALGVLRVFDSTTTSSSSSSS